MEGDEGKDKELRIRIDEEVEMDELMTSEDPAALDFEEIGPPKRTLKTACCYPFPLQERGVPMVIVVVYLFTLALVALIFGFFVVTIANVPVSQWALWLAVMCMIWVTVYNIVLAIWLSLSRHLSADMYYYIAPLPGTFSALVWGIANWPIWHIFLYTSNGASMGEIPVWIDRIFITIIVVSALRLAELVLIRVVVTSTQREKMWFQVMKATKHFNWLLNMLRVLEKKEELKAQRHSLAKLAHESFKGVKGVFTKSAVLLQGRNKEESVPEDVLVVLHKTNLTEEDVEWLAHRIMCTIGRDKKGFWKARHVAHRFSTLAKTVECFKFFNVRSQKKDAVDQTGLEKGIRAIMAEQDAVEKSIQNKEDLVGTLQNAAGVIFWLLMILLIMIIFGLGSEAFLSLGTTFLGLAFVFGSGLQRMFHSVLLVFVITPFDNGDVISDGTHKVKVDRINVFTSEGITPDGKQVYLSNADLFNASITNFSRGGNAVLTYDYTINATTKRSKIAIFEEKMRKWMDQHSSPWDTRGFAVTVGGRSGEDGVSCSLWSPLKNCKWSNGDIWFGAQTDMIMAGRRLLGESGISYNKKPNPVMAKPPESWDDLITFQQKCTPDDFDFAEEENIFVVRGGKEEEEEEEEEGKEEGKEEEEE